MLKARSFVGATEPGKRGEPRRKKRKIEWSHPCPNCLQALGAMSAAGTGARALLPPSYLRGWLRGVFLCIAQIPRANDTMVLLGGKNSSPRMPAVHLQMGQKSVDLVLQAVL